MTLKKFLPNKGCIFPFLNTLIMITVLIVMIYPFWYCIVVSLNDATDYLRGPLYLWPRKFTLSNYEHILRSKVFGVAIRNSVLRTVIGTVLHCLVTGMAAYGLSKRNLMYRKFYTTIFVITMYMSGGMIPTYLLYRSIGLIDNFLVYIIPTMFSFYNCILFMSFFESIPQSLEESAQIDGANIFTIFFKIIFPISKPIFATIALYSVVSQWNSWYDTVTYTKSEGLTTLQSMLVSLLRSAENAEKILEKLAESGATLTGMANQEISPMTLRVATMVVTTFPVVVVYPFFQKYFVKGIMLGSVKG